PEEARRRRDLIQKARRKEDDGEYLDGTFSLCRQACDKLEGASSTLGEAHTILEVVDKKVPEEDENIQLRELLKATVSAQSRISSIVRSFQRLEGRVRQKEEEDRKHFEDAVALLHQACAKMMDASVVIGEANKLAELTDRRARMGAGSRITLSRRIHSKEFLRAISGVRGNLLRIMRAARTTADLQEGAVREAINSEAIFE
ncbi:hypothetical protein LCGC14_1398560, partial [marine sediment metagenome]